MQIEDIVHDNQRELITVGPETTVGDAVAALATNNIGALPVCDGDGIMVGILSERDIVRELSARGPELLALRVVDVMTSDVFSCTPEDDSGDAMEVMQANRFRHIPVVADGRPVAMISTRDLMGAVLNETRQQRQTLAVAYELVR